MNPDSSIPLPDNPVFPGEVFANPADFDTGIRLLLPHYDEMLGAIVRCVPSQASHVLELGCGTGELSLKILRHCPSARILAVDYSPRMLKFARAKVEAAGFSDRWTGIEMDFGEWADRPDSMKLDTPFDACVSSLAIHHLLDEMKLKLFHCVRASLNPGGFFWNADPILPTSEVMKAVYLTVREEWSSQQGTTYAEVRASFAQSTPYGYSHTDQLATLSDQLEMLVTAGFTQVEVPWKYYGLAVFGGWVE